MKLHLHRRLIVLSEILGLFGVVWGLIYLEGLKLPLIGLILTKYSPPPNTEVE